MSEYMIPVAVNLMGGQRLGSGWDLIRKQMMDTAFSGLRRDLSLWKEVFKFNFEEEVIVGQLPLEGENSTC